MDPWQTLTVTGVGKTAHPDWVQIFTFEFRERISETYSPGGKSVLVV